MNLFVYAAMALFAGWLATAVVLQGRISGLRGELAAAEQMRLQSELDAGRFKALAEQCSAKTARLLDAQEATSKAAADAQEYARELNETYRKRAAKVAATLRPPGVAECNAVAGLLEDYRK